MYFETLEEPFSPHFGDLRSGDLKAWNGAAGVPDRCKSASRLLNGGANERDVAWRIFGKDCDISSFRSNSETEKQRDAFRLVLSDTAMDYEPQSVDVRVEAEYVAPNLTATTSHPSTTENSLPWTPPNDSHQPLQLVGGVVDVALRAYSEPFERFHDSKAEFCSPTKLSSVELLNQEVIVLDEETDEPKVLAAGQEGNPILLDDEIDAVQSVTPGDYQEEPIVLDDDTDEEFGWEEDDTVGDMADIKVPNPYLVNMMSSPEIGYDAGIQSLPVSNLKRNAKSCKVEEEHTGPSAMMDPGAGVSVACQWTNSKRIRASYDDDCCSSDPANAPGHGSRSVESRCWTENGLRDQPDMNKAIGETRPHFQGAKSLVTPLDQTMNKEENTAFLELVQFLGDLESRGEILVQSSTSPSYGEIPSSSSEPELIEKPTAQGAVDVVVYQPEPLGSWSEQTSGVLVEVKKETGQICEPVRERGLGPCLRDRRLILAALRTFEQVRQQIIKDPSYGQASPGVEVSSKRLRADLKAACLMRKRNYWLNDEVRPIGDVPGVAVGDRFRYRIEMAVIGLHRAVQAGIAIIPPRFTSYNVPIACSVVISASVSDPYGDDEDYGDTVVYSGQGGLCCKTRESQDQQLTRGNLALSNSKERNLPVRLIRGHRNPNIVSGVSYSYDGLYQIHDMVYVKGKKSGKMVYKFEMRRLPGQRPYKTFEESSSPACIVPTLASPSGLKRSEIDWAQVPKEEPTMYLEKGQA